MRHMHVYSHKHASGADAQARQQHTQTRQQHIQTRQQHTQTRQQHIQTRPTTISAVFVRSLGQ